MAVPTVDEILDALGEYADYEELADVSRAKAYLTACRRFLALPSSSSDQGSALGYTPQLIQGEMDIARRWIAANDTSARNAGAHVRTLVCKDGFRR